MGGSRNPPEQKGVPGRRCFPASNDLEWASLFFQVVQALTLTWIATVRAKHDVATTVRADIKKIAQYSTGGNRVSGGYNSRDLPILISKEYRVVELSDAVELSRIAGNEEYCCPVVSQEDWSLNER